mgnify:FL=1
MLDALFILTLLGGLAITFHWAFKTLPGEQWQIIGCFPTRKLPNGHWQGWNITWYGFFNAAAILFAVLILIILLESVSMRAAVSLPMFVLILSICLPASQMLALFIEKKRNTATVGGASFVGILIAPWIIQLTQLAGDMMFNVNISIMSVLSAMFIAYAFGEGVGRLACISFGCCYGKPLKDCSPLVRKIFQRHHFIFTGKTKKIAYAHELDGQQVVPVQAVTALIYSFTGLIGCHLFLQGHTTHVFVMTLTVTQIWRFLSEFLRADYRGEGTISVYQIMALFSCFYGLIIAFIFHETNIITPDLALGLSSLWNPVLFLFLMVLWIITLFYTGKSKVTSAFIQIKVNEKEI